MSLPLAWHVPFLHFWPCLVFLHFPFLHVWHSLQVGLHVPPASVSSAWARPRRPRNPPRAAARARRDPAAERERERASKRVASMLTSSEVARERGWRPDARTAPS